MKKEKTAEEQKFEEFYLPEDFYGDEEEDIETCDYGLDSGEGCVKPSLKHIGNCFECWLYQEVMENSEEAESESSFTYDEDGVTYTKPKR